MYLPCFPFVICSPRNDNRSFFLYPTRLSCSLCTHTKTTCICIIHQTVNPYRDQKWIVKWDKNHYREIGKGNRGIDQLLYYDNYTTPSVKINTLSTAYGIVQNPYLICEIREQTEISVVETCLFIAKISVAKSFHGGCCFLCLAPDNSWQNQGAKGFIRLGEGISKLNITCT